MNAEAAIAVSPDYFAKLAYQHTIPRELTHKRRLENVYLTSLNRVSQQEFLVGAYVPHANTFVNDMRCDPNDVTLTIVEIGRQIGIALSHEFLGVRYDNAFVLRDMEVEVLPAMRAIDWPENETLYAQALIDEQKFLETGELASARANVLFYVGEQCVCRQSSNSYVQQQSRYLKLRELTRTKHARSLKLYGADAPGLSGGFKIRTHSALKRPVIEDTLWAASDANKFIATLRVDRDNRFFFDHDNDHVPGMLLVEGMRELSVDICTRFSRERALQIQRMQMEFTSFAELDSPVQLIASVIRASSGESLPIGICLEGRQSNRLVAKAQFSVC